MEVESGWYCILPLVDGATLCAHGWDGLVHNRRPLTARRLYINAWWNAVALALAAQIFFFHIKCRTGTQGRGDDDDDNNKNIGQICWVESGWYMKRQLLIRL